MDSSLPLSAAAYRPSIRAPSRMQPPPTISSPSFPTTPDDPPAHLDFTSAAAPLPTQPVTAWSFPMMIDASVDAYATTAATAMPPQFSYSRDGSRSKACAACRFRNQKCKDDCLLAPFFPASEDSKFQKARRLFGVSKMQKILKGLIPEQRAVAMATMIYEAELHSQIERRAAHLAFLRQHAAVVAPPAPSLDTIGTGDGGIIPPPLH
ncbi:hypothetical protein ZIOFF_020956 [Zingiber officinale]|uniref:LOB domain-containing protein n=1 Tax=Zingiber officinale TaxID=94328 RepID=A0A8J5H7R9_ZINOF|nr:hypothetical protein ZIOFF_020956 [Zingiber officinale]